jgi:carboxylesterase type B
MFGGSDFYGPKYFMKKEVVLVTINYRLGPMGFLSTEDEILPGNLGLKDQAMALKWVNRNIEKFKGDKNKITIMGYSAGGASVHFHYFSPLSKNLFKNGISFSGCALNPWTMSENSLEKAHIVANYLECPIDDHEKMLLCLKKLPANKIVATMELFQPFLYNPISPMGIVVERNNSKDPFLIEFPSVLLKKGKLQKKPWLATATQAEGLYPAAEFYNIDYLEQIDKNWDLLAPHILDFDGVLSDPIHKKEISRKIRKHYFEDDESCHKISRKYFDGLTDVSV